MHGRLILLSTWRDRWGMGVALLLLCASHGAAEVAQVPKGSTWRYLADSFMQRKATSIPFSARISGMSSVSPLRYTHLSAKVNKPLPRPLVWNFVRSGVVL